MGALPGGQTTAEVVSALSSLAETYGNPDLQLTSRAGIHLRGLPEPLPPGVARTVLGLGLLPSLPHERATRVVLRDSCRAFGSAQLAENARGEHFAQPVELHGES